MHPRLHLTLSLASLAALGPLAFAAFLPALPTLGKEFGLSIPATQSLLAVYLAALASAQLLSAWAANVFGKRPVLIGGALLLCAGSAVCALASIPWDLQLGRILQGCGAGAATALLPLLLRTHSSRAVRLLADGAIPILAPVAGALSVLYASWRFTFWLPAAAGLLALLLLAMAPAAPHKEDEPFHFAELTGNRDYWRYTSCHALCFGALAAGLACLPIMVSLHLGLGAGHIAVVQAVGALAILLQSFSKMQAEPGRDPMSQQVIAGIGLMFFAGCLGFGWDHLEKNIDPFYYLLGCWAAMCYGFALCMTPLAAGALKAAGRHARAGLSLLQFASNAVAAAAILLTAREDIDRAAFTAFGIATLMVIVGGMQLPSFVWRSAMRNRY